MNFSANSAQNTEHQKIQFSVWKAMALIQSISSHFLILPVIYADEFKQINFSLIFVIIHKKSAESQKGFLLCHWISFQTTFLEVRRKWNVFMLV